MELHPDLFRSCADYLGFESDGFFCVWGGERERRAWIVRNTTVTVSSPRKNGYFTMHWLIFRLILHREDGPAVCDSNGSEWWMRKGKYHRENGPAVEYPNGDKEWYWKGRLHREDGPALVYIGEKKEWHLSGILVTQSLF